MAGVLITGTRTWSLARDADGHRTYKVRHLVVADGPATALTTPGLPAPGAVWSFPNDVDNWAWCRADADVKLHQEREGEGRTWAVDQTFSTRPPERCQTTAVADPLLEPQQVSGSSVRYSEEATEDRFGNPVVNSAHEPLRGPPVEFDANRSQVVIAQNVAALELALCESLRDHVNDAPLWGLAARCVKLSDFSWEKKYQGSCQPYYTRKFTFDLHPGTFDREALDEGTKMLAGDWSETDPPVYTPKAWADAGNPAHFVQAKDRAGENIRVVLNRGLPIAAKLQGYITGATNAAPIVITSAAHGLVTQKRVAIYQVAGNTAANFSWRVTVLTADTFSLDGSTGNGAYAGGGYWKNTSDEDQPGAIWIERYEEGNLLLLGIPTTF
jgi:hypothetical protein